jgi:hypothetical protein
MHSKKYPSKIMASLPSNLSDFSWIENTSYNKELLDDERFKY